MVLGEADGLFRYGKDADALAQPRRRLSRYSA